jgi:hypothetical protein
MAGDLQVYSNHFSPATGSMRLARPDRKMMLDAFVSQGIA